MEQQVIFQGILGEQNGNSNGRPWTKVTFLSAYMDGKKDYNAVFDTFDSDSINLLRTMPVGTPVTVRFVIEARQGSKPGADGQLRWFTSLRAKSVQQGTAQYTQPTMYQQYEAQRYAPQQYANQQYAQPAPQQTKYVNAQAQAVYQQPPQPQQMPQAQPAPQQMTAPAPTVQQAEADLPF